MSDAADKVPIRQRLGESIWGAHAGLTAEGDNRVLMQKVAKELLAMADKKELMKDVAISYLQALRVESGRRPKQ